MYWMLKLFLSFMISYEIILSHDWPPLPPGRFNAAFNKRTFQSSDYYQGNVDKLPLCFSGNAVDGDHNSEYFEKSCTETGHTEHTWWAVDLGLEYYIYSVTLTNRVHEVEHVYKRLQNFTIFGSNRFYIPGSDDAVLCAFQADPMGNGETKTFPCAENFTARFVVINKTTPVYDLMTLTLCEVEVEARCLVGFYGENCSDICPENCALGSSCNAVDGTCSKGCNAAYYGQRCSNQCENSCQDVCDHVTGACECEDGYSGFKCDIKTSEGFISIVVPICITAAVIIVSMVIGIVVYKVMRNKRTVTKTNDNDLTTKNNDVTDSVVKVPVIPADYDDIITSGVRDNPGFSPSTSEAEQYEDIRSCVNADNALGDLHVYVSIKE